MSHKIDERKDNIRKISETIKNTKDNMEFADDMIEAAPDARHKRLLEAQNNRRAEAIDALQDELKEQIVGKEKKNK